MSQIHEGPVTFAGGAALLANRRVKVASGVLQYCSSSERGIGTLINDIFANTNKASGYDDGAVRTWCNKGTHKFVASEAITVHNAMYGAANGKVAASGTITVGEAFDPAAADLDVIEGMPLGNADVSGDVGGTTGAAFLVDSDSAIPKIELASAVGGTGDFKASIKPPATLTADRVFTLPADSAQTLVGTTATQTLTNKTITGVSAAMTAGITSSGATGAGIGYAAGAGGAVSQLTDRTTGVTLDKLTGAITTQATSLAAAASVQFTVTNSTVAVGDVIVLSVRSGPTNTTTSAHVVTVAAGSFKIMLFNAHASVADTGAAIINFAVLKAVSA